MAGSPKSINDVERTIASDGGLWTVTRISGGFLRRIPLHQVTAGAGGAALRSKD